MTTVRPGGVIGILGGGQLGAMMAADARRMGYRVAVLDPDPAAPAAALADWSIRGALDDAEVARAFAGYVDVVTLDTEHVPADLLAAIDASVPVRPAPAVLRIIQDRLEQRRFLQAQGLPQARFAAVSSAAELREAAGITGLPGVLKSRRAGYDGKGQARVFHADAADAVWATVGVPAVLESFVDFALEISVVLARDLHGNMRFYPVTENTHRRHVLHTTRVPARIPDVLQAEARDIAATIARALDAVGVVAVELFVTRDGGLLVNEIAPRTHNSGHFTLGACATSQFEQHIRAICGLPLGDPSLLRPAVMLNLLGDLWHHGAPDMSLMLEHPGARVHLYNKRDARPGRKMGHVLVTDEQPEAALLFLESALARLTRGTDAFQRAEAC